MNYLDLKALETSLASSEGIDHLITKLHANARKPRPDVTADYARGMTAGLVVCANALGRMFDRHTTMKDPVLQAIEERREEYHAAASVAAETRVPAPLEPVAPPVETPA